MWKACVCVCVEVKHHIPRNSVATESQFLSCKTRSASAVIRESIQQIVYGDTMAKTHLLFACTNLMYGQTELTSDDLVVSVGFAPESNHTCMIGMDVFSYFSTRIAKGRRVVFHNLSDIPLVSASGCIEQGQTDLVAPPEKKIRGFRLLESFRVESSRVD